MSNERKHTPLLQEIRKQVRERLVASPAYRSLDPERRRQIAHDTVNALAYITGGEDGQNQPQAVTLAGNSASFAPLAGRTAIAPGAVAALKGGAKPDAQTAKPIPQLRPRPAQIGEAARAGSQAFTDTIANVNFPAFVAGLIDGVFNSIVTTSIKQMEEYAEMVRNVSKSVDQYMKDNVSENQARDYLADKYPDYLEIDITGEKPVVKPKDGHDDGNLPDFFADLGLKMPVQALDEDNVEQVLVPAARRRIAMDRQQLLATMVMMGVNRLVVTNGTIEASCMFELDTSDVRKRTGTRTADKSHDRQNVHTDGYNNDNTTTNKSSGEWSEEGDNRDASGKWKTDSTNKSSWYGKNTNSDIAKFKMTTVDTRADESTINMHAQLGGKVKVNFKSDYFPMEKMIDVFQVNQIREKTAVGIAPPAQPTSPVLPPPPLPPMPPITMPATPAAPAAPFPARV